MANFGLVDLPVSVLLIIVLYLEAADPAYADVLSFCFAHPQFQQFVTGKPYSTVSFPQPVADQFFSLHNVFIDRALYVLEGLQQERFYHFHPKFQLWFDELEKRVGRRGVTESVFRLLRLDILELLCANTPPSTEQWLALAKKETGNFMSVYILLLQYGDTVYIYCGSATDQIKGFCRRLSEHINRNSTKMPQFIANLIRTEEEFSILMVLPILHVFLDDRDDVIFGDIRAAMFLIETMMMVWNNSLKPGTKWENLMAYSPWTKDMRTFVRINVGLSTKLEWPKGELKSEEAIAIAKERKKARRAVYRALPEIKARTKAKDAAYEALPETKAKRAAYEALPETKARKAAYEALPERKATLAAYKALPEYKAKEAAYEALPETKARKAAYNALPANKAKAAAAYKAKKAAQEARANTQS